MIFPLLKIQYTALFHTTSVVNNSLLDNNFFFFKEKPKLISKLPFWPFVDWKGFVGMVTFTNPYIRSTLLLISKTLFY